MAPHIEISATMPLTVTVTFIEKPEVSIKKGVDSIKVPATEIKVDEKDVQRMVEYILDQHKQVQEIEREAREGDQMTMDFVGVDSEGKEIEGTRSSGYQVRIGSNTLIPGFEEALKGMKPGDEKSFTVTFPEKYHAEHLRGKPATFTVKATKLEDVKLPELTDSFVKEHLSAESAEEFKKRMHESMAKQEEDLGRQKREEQFLDALVNAVVADFPQELIDNEAQSILVDLHDQLKQQGATIEDWLKQTDRTPEQLQTELKEQAERRLKLRFGMEKALQEKNIQVSDEEVAELIAKMIANARPAERGQLEAAYVKGSSDYEQLRWRRRVEKLIEGMLG